MSSYVYIIIYNLYICQICSLSCWALEFSVRASQKWMTSGASAAPRQRWTTPFKYYTEAVEVRRTTMDARVAQCDDPMPGRVIQCGV